MNQYRYKFVDPSGEFFADPLGENTINVQYNQPREGSALYVIKITGKLRLIKADFLRLRALEVGSNRCADIQGTVQRRQGSGWVDIVSGRILLMSGDWNIDTCTVDIPITAIDKDAFLRDSKDVNIFESVPAAKRVTVNTIPFDEGDSGLSDFTLENYSYDSPTEGWIKPSGSSPLYDEPINAGYVMTRWQNTINYGDPVYDPNDGRIVDHCTNDASPETNWSYIYTRWVSYIPAADPIPPGAIDLNEFRVGDGYRKIARVPSVGSWNDIYADTDCLYNRWSERSVFDNPTPPTLNINIDNGVLLADLLATLLKPYGLLPKSEFFNIRATVQAETINYVTNDKTTTGFVIFFQKSDVKRYDATENATIFKISLKNLIKYLNESFNVKYDIQGTDFILEHVSWFQNIGTLDLTADPKWIAGLNSYSYIIEGIPGQEVFTFMEKRPDVQGVNDFNGLPIIYNDGCVTGNEEDVNHAVEKITTDFPYIYENRTSDIISDDGFVMVSANKDGSGVYHMMRAPRLVGVEREMNNPFGWAWLHNNFWKHDRYLLRGTMNGSLQDFFSSKPTRESAEIKIPYCNIEAFDPRVKIITPVGEGILQQGQWNLSTKLLTLKVGYADIVPVASGVYLRFSIEDITTIDDEMMTCGGVEKQWKLNKKANLTIRLYADLAGTIPLVGGAIPVDADGFFWINYLMTVKFNGAVDSIFSTGVGFPIGNFVGNTAKTDITIIDENNTCVSDSKYEWEYNILTRFNYIIIP